MSKIGKNLDDLLDINRAQVLDYLSMHEGCSRMALAKATGLKSASITKIVRSLIESGLVFETGLTAGAKGRRSIGLSLNYEKHYVIGVKLSWERLILRVFDLHGNAQSEPINYTFDFIRPENASTIVGLIADTIQLLKNRFPNIAAAGIAVPGPYHRGDGSLYIKGSPGDAPVLYPLRNELTARVPLPTFIDHDANAGAVGYWRFKTNRDPKMVLLHLLASEGIGGGVVAKGQIFTGRRNRSAEIGHIVVDFDGRQCCCGSRGCLDAYTSSVSVEQRARELAGDFPASELARAGHFSVGRIFQALRNGDELALFLIREVGEYMGRGFASLIPVFDPDLIVISDIMASGGDVLLESITRSVEERLSKFYKKPDIVLANPDEDLVLHGATAVAIEHLLDKPTEYLVNN